MQKFSSWLTTTVLSCVVAGVIVNGGTIANFDNINDIRGGTDTASNELTGPNLAGNAWDVTGSGTLTNGVNSIVFDFFDLLSGGTDSDTFTLNGGNVAGTINGNGGNDTLIGLTGPNVWDVSGADSGTVTDANGANVFVAIDNLTGNGATDAISLSGTGSVSGTIDAAGGTDTITGRDNNTTWNIKGANTGDSPVRIGSFVNTENLTGGTADDTFNLNGGTITGTIDGGAGGGSDTLVGDETANTWIIAGTNAGNVNGQLFTDTENLTGGNTVDDTFSFGDGSDITGLIDGRGQAVADTVDLSAQTGFIAITVGGALSGVTNIETIRGNGANSTLTGDNVVNNWTLTADNQGTVGTLNFEQFNNLIGGTAADTFNVNFAVSGGIDGGDGGDTFNLGAGTPSVSGGNGTDTANLTADFTQPGIFTISDVESVLNPSNSTITTSGAGNGLVIVNATGAIGTAGNPILTSVTRLQIQTSSADAFFVETNGVILEGIDLGGANTFDLTTTLGTITDSGVPAIPVDVNNLVLNSAAGIGTFADPLDTTAAFMDVTLNNDSNAFIDTTADIADVLDVQLTASVGGGTQVALIGANSLQRFTNNINSFLTDFGTGDTIGFRTVGDIVMASPLVQFGSGRNFELVAGGEIVLDLSTGTQISTIKGAVDGLVSAGRFGPLTQRIRFKSTVEAQGVSTY